jgi:hypothetical protein
MRQKKGNLIAEEVISEVAITRADLIKEEVMAGEVIKEAEMTEAETEGRAINSI